MSEETHFGYRRVPIEEKAAHVGQVFDSVADRYDLMNDLMSFGVHRLWKRRVIDMANPRLGQHCLDLASGTGDLAAALAKRVSRPPARARLEDGGGERQQPLAAVNTSGVANGRVVAADINFSMLSRGRDRLLDRGIAEPIHYVQADAEQLPFPDSSFDLVTIAFGLRNVTRKEIALEAMARVLRPGGRLLILEFSKPRVPGLKPLYDLYSFTALPMMGRMVVDDAESYRYLAESIRMHPDQESLREMMTAAGLSRCDYLSLSGGIVAIHWGYRL